jgi:hypothetical protein
LFPIVALRRLYFLVPGKLCNLIVHDAEDRIEPTSGHGQPRSLGAPSCALDSPLPRSDRSAIHCTPRVQAFACFSNILASQHRLGQCGRESGSCDHRRQLTSGVAGRNNTLTHQWTHVPAVKLGILLLSATCDLSRMVRLNPRCHRISSRQTACTCSLASDVNVIVLDL